MKRVIVGVTLLCLDIFVLAKYFKDIDIDSLNDYLVSIITGLKFIFGFEMNVEASYFLSSFNFVYLSCIF